MNPEIMERITEIAEEHNETKTFVIESLLKFAIDAYDSEKEKKVLNTKPKK